MYAQLRTEILRGYDFAGVEFSIILLIFAWDFTTCSAIVLNVICNILCSEITAKTIRHSRNAKTNPNPNPSGLFGIAALVLDYNDNSEHLRNKSRL